MEDLEKLDSLLRSAPRQGQAMLVSEQVRADLGWTAGELVDILRALNFTPAAKPKPGEPAAWRRRGERQIAPTPVTQPGSPFAALAALKDRPPPNRRPRHRRAKPTREVGG